MNKRFIFAAGIYLIFAHWCHGQAERNSQVASGEIHEVPLKEILQIIYKPYERVDLPFSLMLTFNIEQNGSFSKIRLIQSSGDRILDEAGIEILSKLGESHSFIVFYGLSSNTVRIELSEKNLRLQIIGFSPSQSEAKAKFDMLRQLMMDVTRKAEKNSEIDKLLRRVMIRNRDKRVDLELTVPRAELLK